MGDKNFAEEYIVGQLYYQALKAKGFSPTLKANIGSSEVIDKAFQSNQVQLYPEYTGEIVSTVAGQKQGNSAAATYTKAKAFEQAHRSGTLLKQTAFQDVDDLVVKPAFAHKYHLKTVGDLKNVGPPNGKKVLLGAQPSFQHRYEGVVGIKKAYGVTGLTFKPLPVGVDYHALDSGSINVADAFSTDGQLLSGKYVSLKDPKHIFGFQHVAPVVKQSLLKKEGPAFAQTLNWVDSLLTVHAIQTLNAAVQVKHDQPAAVARKFLAANGLK
ncbi:MAG TPA: glycine betaine ABC transporter substrate-binding protein [Acidimicrobiales bacterium]|nr:glycine betaine ABC transporter substrate-binding protein [Acidimicrobiales bacterium]